MDSKSSANGYLTVQFFWHNYGVHLIITMSLVLSRLRLPTPGM